MSSSFIMNKLDLDIKNYSLEDILSLFKLPINFDEEGLKRAKKQVLMMHPDKSRMDKEYFLFFSSAYRLLYKVYKFRTRNEQDATVNRHYDAEDIDCEDDNSHVWQTLSKHKQFNSIFNKMFEKNGTSDNCNGNGYGDWLKEEDLVSTAKNRDEMNNFIDERKKSLRSIIKYNGVSATTCGSAGTDLVGNEDNFRSNMFSSLQYDDLKQAYTESVVPVSMEDYEKREKYQNVEHLQRSRRAEEKLSPNQEEYFAAKHSQDDEEDASRAFCLAKQDEEMRVMRSKMASNFLRITRK